MRKDAGSELQAGLRTLAGGDVFSKDDDAAEGSGTSKPGAHFPAQKLNGTVGAVKPVFFVFDGFAAERATMNGEPARGEIGKYLVMRSTKNV